MIAKNLLKPREIDVLCLMAERMSNREIGDQLYIGVETVKWYAKNIYSKLDVANRKEAVRKAEVLGLLNAPSPIDETKVSVKHNLPSSATPFVGREQEIKQLVALLMNETNRLVTILAPGGMGKTRLSIEVAQQLLDKFRDGVFFVPLAPLRSADDILTTIIDSLGFNFDDGDIVEQMLNALQERSILLVLDNFEHLMDGTTLVVNIVNSVSNAKIMVTSRERLNIYGEQVYNLSGMVFPTWETPEDALEYDSVRLFMQSARRNRTDYALHSEDLDFLARICKLTAGMPLGIELAAGWVDVFSLEQIANEIRKGIDIFETEMRDLPERHRSLRATFERTWERLTTKEQQIFMNLSVFRGGFTIESAQAVAGASPRILQKLVQKALIQFDDRDRFGIHELLRQFGALKLEESGDFQLVNGKHAEYFIDFIAKRNHELKCERQVQGAALIDPDFENIRLAWYHLSDHHLWDKIPNFRYALWLYCDMRTRAEDAISMYEYTLHILDKLPDSDVVQIAKGQILAWASWHYRGRVTMRGRDRMRGRLYAEEAITLLEGIDDALPDLILARHTLTSIPMYTPDLTSDLPSAMQDFALAQKLGDPTLLAHTAIFAVLTGLGEVPTELLQQAKHYAEMIGERFSLWMCALAESLIAYSQGNVDLSIRILEEGLQHVVALNSAFHFAMTSRYLGIFALEQGKFDKATYHLVIGLRQLWDIGETGWTHLKRIFQAHIYKGDYKRAVTISRLLDEVQRDLVDGDYHEDAAINVQIRYEEIRAELEQHLKDEQLEHLWQAIEKPTLGNLIHSLLADFDDIDKYHFK